MKVTIKYCGEWNYLPDASRVEEELKANFDNISIELIRGGGGVFEVKVNGEMVFSKISGPNATWRFPNDGEVTDLIHQQEWK